jgi:hypothetical protein
MTPEQRAVWMAGRTKHGGFLGGKERPEHYVWRAMLARCYSPKSSGFKYYGARGIKVCKRWHNYAAFIADIGERPSPQHSLERKNTDGDYKPSNCYWATRSVQQKNKTSTKWYSNGTFTGTLVECAEYLGISKELAHWRWKTHSTFMKGQTWHQLQRVA